MYNNRDACNAVYRDRIKIISPISRESWKPQRHVVTAHIEKMLNYMILLTLYNFNYSLCEVPVIRKELIKGVY